MQQAIGASWLCLTLTACGGEGTAESASPDAPRSCNFQAEIAGPTSVTLTGNNDVLCYPAPSYLKGLRAWFVTPDVQVSIDVHLQDVLEGETGANYRVRLTINDQNHDLPDRHWFGMDCVASVTQHEYLRTLTDKVNGDLREYRVAIEGTCPQPIPSSIPEVGPVTMDAFSFTVPYLWEQPIAPSM
jgi:hypothetical protein